MSTFYVVATPIGNLEDITYRAVRILKEVDLVLCEDTRVTKKLLEHYEINKPLLSFHQHSDERKIREIMHHVSLGENIALVTDSGTPNVSDPGGKLIELISARGGSVFGWNDLARLPARQGLRIEPIPGPSAITTLISVAGIDLHEFLFLGFLPHKKGRQTLIKKIIASDIPVIVYESVHRVEKFLNELEKLGLGSDRQLIVGRELTKMFETIYRGNLAEIKEQLIKDQIRGEFVVIIDK